MEFFRCCLECGRRFHVKLENKRLVRMERQERRSPQLVRRGGPPHGIRGSRVEGLGPVTTVYKGPPTIVDVEEFQYNYKCKHCGHEWSEKRIEEHKEG